MSEIEFYNLLIRTIRYGDYEERNKLFSLLKYAYVTFDKTSQFTRKS